MHTNYFAQLCRLGEEKNLEHAMACLSLPALLLAPVVVVFMQCAQLFFFCLRSSASFRTWWSSGHIWQYKHYSDKATERYITTTNYQQLFDTANKQTYTTTKYQSNSWFSEENKSVVTSLLRNRVHSNEFFFERKEILLKFLTTFLEKHNLLITRRSFLLLRASK